jgi:hypothetical protein
MKSWKVFGPTCDPLDVLPHRLDLPRQHSDEDYIEFGTLGAYGIATSTMFNGYGDHKIVSRGARAGDVRGGRARWRGGASPTPSLDLSLCQIQSAPAHVDNNKKGGHRLGPLIRISSETPCRLTPRLQPLPLPWPAWGRSPCPFR